MQDQWEWSVQAWLEKQIQNPSIAVYILEMGIGISCWTSHWFNCYPHQSCRWEHCWLQASCRCSLNSEEKVWRYPFWVLITISFSNVETCTRVIVYLSLEFGAGFLRDLSISRGLIFFWLCLLLFYAPVLHQLQLGLGYLKWKLILMEWTPPTCLVLHRWSSRCVGFHMF